MFCNKELRALKEYYQHYSKAQIKLLLNSNAHVDAASVDASKAKTQEGQQEGQQERQNTRDSVISDLFRLKSLFTLMPSFMPFGNSLTASLFTSIEIASGGNVIPLK